MLNLKFKKQTGRPERDNAIDLFVRSDTTERELAMLDNLLETTTERFSEAEKEEWLRGMKNITLGSDAFFPFRDNIDRAYRSGVKYILHINIVYITILICNIKYGVIA